ncbi:roadblock/LC7 domain-containing protein [Streptomyces sp. NPDC091376]|uniref:roadblock/LC7 domain-containing protein n=1 Tax=Streptomyces sp. NPDC091376 TaxID=3365994 RepID=UPI00382686F2
MNGATHSETDTQTAFEEFIDAASVQEAVLASADGLLLASSAGLPRDRADQLAALATGLVSLGGGACALFGGGTVLQTMVEMDRGILFVTRIPQGGALAAIAADGCDVGSVSYELSAYAQSVVTPGRHP